MNLEGWFRMPWTQVIDPFGNLLLSALVDGLPVAFLFVALAIFRMRGHVAGLLTLGLALLVAILVHGMPAEYALWSGFYGALFGLWPIGWIILTAVFLYNLVIKSGRFEVIKDSIAGVTGDRRLQALLIAFAFGAFLEGAAGFGTPVAIAAAMLVGLGFKPLYAAGLCLIANTAPVAFGAIGIPIITAGAVTGLEVMSISQMVGRQVPFLAFFLSFWLIFVMAGWRKTLEVWPAILVGGGSFALTQWFTANYVSPMLPDIAASLMAIAALTVFLRVWQPPSLWLFPEEPPASMRVRRHDPGTLLTAWAPFLILTVLIADWGLGPVKALLGVASVRIPLTPIDGMIVAGGQTLRVVFNWNLLEATGTAILLAAVLAAFVLRIEPKRFLAVFRETLWSLRFALLTVASVLGFAFVANWSGMTPTLGRAFTVTGVLFPFMSAFLGWLGVFITGSDTSSNALFAKMQQITAENTGLNPVLTVATNSSGGVTGKMISPQNLAVGAAATGLVGREGDLFRFAVGHSLFFAAVVGGMAMLQAYLLPGMVPPPVPAGVMVPDTTRGGADILFWSGMVILVLLLLIYRLTPVPRPAGEVS